MQQEGQIPVHFLYPANLYAPREPYLINTILGSCVAVCLFDPIFHIGGMNHYMLPLWNGQGLPSPKYGNIAIERLINKLEANGAKREHLKAKVFGGGEVLQTSSGGFKIGPRNIEIAWQLLEKFKISVVASHTGGNLGRKIQLNSQTGEVKLRMIEKVKYQEINKVIKQ